MRLKHLLADWVLRAGRIATSDVQDRIDMLEAVLVPQPPITRASVARHYLRGRGLEIGALHRPLPLPHGVVAEYVDVAPVEVLRARFPDVGEIRAPDIIDNGEALFSCADAAYDFIVANHFLEHAENPFDTLKNFVRVLRPGGVIFMAIPDKRWTFDLPREITPLSHILRDYREGPETSRRAHYEEWLSLIDGHSGVELENRIDAFVRDRVNIHFHVWTFREMAEMFLAAREEVGLKLDIQLAYADEPALEIIWVLRVRP
jgi:SAM-dependent methyltransferase